MIFGEGWAADDRGMTIASPMRCRHLGIQNRSNKFSTDLVNRQSVIRPVAGAILTHRSLR